MEKKQGAINFDVENPIASLTGFRKKYLSKGKYASQKIIDIKGFSTINIHCNLISGVKDNGNSIDILYTFTLTEPTRYQINIIPTNILYQNVTKDRIEYIEFHIKDENGRPIDFNGDMLSFTLHLIQTQIQSQSQTYTQTQTYSSAKKFPDRLTHRLKPRLRLRLRLILRFILKVILILYYETLQSQLILSLPQSYLFLDLSMTT